MQSIGDFLNSIFEGTKQRVKNPLFGSFILSWIILNWEFILVFFTQDLSTLNKIEYLNAYCKSNFIGDLFLTPLIISLVYLILSDWVFMVLKYLSIFGRLKRKKQNFNFLTNELEPEHKYLEKKT
jgi:hypothetical protein|tara:strand:+ start:616 stop:990 length:375 start_codon:yes stop_codon:yes gene_type:complete